MSSTARRRPSDRVRTRRASAIVIVLSSALLWAGCAAAPALNSAPTPSETRPRPTASPTPEVERSVTAVEPASSSVSGGTTLTITGTGLTDVTDVTIGGLPATDVSVTDDGTVTAVAPAATDFQPVTSVPVVVSSGDQPLSQPTALTHSYAALTAVDKQMQYALAHWDNYNVAAWGDLNPVGGDCANFVSQTLIQRGWAQNATWFNKNAAADWSPAWGYAPAMNNWFAGDKSLGLTKLTLAQRDQVKVGDVGMFDWNLNDIPDHVMLVSSVTVVDGVTKIAFVSHNLDGDYRDLDTVITVEHPKANAWFWSVPA